MTLAQADQILDRGMIRPLPAPPAVVDQKSPGELRLKSLKRYFGNAFYVFDTKLSPKIKANDQIALRDFHEKIKCINTWLKSMGYLQTFLPAEYKMKAVKLYSNYLRNSVYQSHSNIILEKNSFVFP